MRKPLSKNTVLKLQNTDHTYMIDRVLGVGANSIVYSARWEDSFGLPHFVRIKELCPAKAEIDRNDDGSLTWNTDSERDAALQHFESEYKKHQQLSSWQDTINSTVQYQESLLFGNSTAYMIMGTDNGKPYSEVTDANLNELFKTLLALAKAVALYHEKGMLLLDIKPENFLVLPETRELVKLFDFDSVVSEHKVMELNTLISYSYDYAAPELRLGKRKNICKATDYYAVGAIAFSRIMNRFPEADDCLRFSDWDMSDNSLFSSTSPKSQRLIKAFFRKTLASHVNARYSSDQELIDVLQSIAEETTPGRCFLYSARRAPLASFIGREQELGKIHAAFTDGANNVFLRGLGGIGKTELAKTYAKRFANEYDTVCFGTYKTDTNALLKDQSFISFANAPAENATAESILRRLSLTDPHTLLIVDDYSFSEDDSLFENLLSLPCRVLITTREQTKDLFANEQTIRHITLGSLQTDEQWDLFSAGYHGLLTGEEKQNIEKLFKAVDGHTMFIDLFAKNLQATGLSASEAVARFEKNGFSEISEAKIRSMKDGTKTDTIEGYFRTLFDISNLSNDAKRALSCLALLGGIHIDKRFLCELSGGSLDVLNLELINRDWVQYSEDLDEITSHSIVVTTIKDETDVSISSLPHLKEYISQIFELDYTLYYDAVFVARLESNMRFIQVLISNNFFGEGDLSFIAHSYASFCLKFFSDKDGLHSGIVFDRAILQSLCNDSQSHSNMNISYDIARIKLYFSLIECFYPFVKEPSEVMENKRRFLIQNYMNAISILRTIDFGDMAFECASHDIKSSIVFNTIVEPSINAVEFAYYKHDDIPYESCPEFAELILTSVREFMNRENMTSYQKEALQSFASIIEPELLPVTSNYDEDDETNADKSPLYTHFEILLGNVRTVFAVKAVIDSILRQSALSIEEKGNLFTECVFLRGITPYRISYYTIRLAPFEDKIRFRERALDKDRLLQQAQVAEAVRDAFVSLRRQIINVHGKIEYADYHDYDDCPSLPPFVWLDSWTEQEFCCNAQCAISYLIVGKMEKADLFIAEMIKMFKCYNAEKTPDNETRWYRQDCRDSIWNNYQVYLNYLYMLELYKLCLIEIKRFEDSLNDYRNEGTLLNIYEVAIRSAREIGDSRIENLYQKKRKKLTQTEFRFDDTIEPFFI